MLCCRKVLFKQKLLLSDKTLKRALISSPKSHKIGLRGYLCYFEFYWTSINFYALLSFSGQFPLPEWQTSWDNNKDDIWTLLYRSNNNFLAINRCSSVCFVKIRQTFEVAQKAKKFCNDSTFWGNVIYYICMVLIGSPWRTNCHNIEHIENLYIERLWEQDNKCSCSFFISVATFVT